MKIPKFWGKNCFFARFHLVRINLTKFVGFELKYMEEMFEMMVNVCGGSVSVAETLNEEDEVKITFIPFVKENKKKQKKDKKKDAECTSNARPSGSLTTALPTA